ncbi:hypothetical protein [Helicobacter burdigaliensis]|uniref:hypothetical protein n=1 Tax=Helicobacter burdigaliensis TaxID=2315334 RepID=UPI000EF7267E|nr:hypothetical protein [Helicobacter burdigaliensis]
MLGGVRRGRGVFAKKERKFLFRLLCRSTARSDRDRNSLLQKNSRGDWEEFTCKFSVPTSRLRELLLNKEFRRIGKLKRNDLNLLDLHCVLLAIKSKYLTF